MKENIIIQIVTILGSLNTTLLKIVVPKTYNNKKAQKEDIVVREKEPSILLSYSSSILEQTVVQIDQEYSKIYIKFMITLIAINQKNTKSGLYNFTAKLCYSRMDPYIYDGLLATKEHIFIEDLLNIDSFGTNHVDFVLEWDTKIENKFLPDSYYVYLYYNVIGEHEQKRVKISSNDNIFFI